MKVYILLGYYKYEGSDILGVYSDLQLANEVDEKGEWKKKKYDYTEIHETELNSSVVKEVDYEPTKQT